MISLQLLIKIYGNTERAVHSAQVLMDNELKDLDVSATYSFSKDRWLTLEISGEDEEFAANFLTDKYGKPVTDVKAGDICKGFIHLIEDDRIVVDIGMPVDVPGNKLKVLGTGNAQQIASRFGIIGHLPVEVEITDARNKTGIFTKKQVDILWDWKKSGYDHVVANAVTRSELKAAIKKTGHARDIFGIERLGLMEHVITCRENTEGPGIVAAIGKLVSGELGVIKAS
ncbi:DUF2110 family protein [Methanolobus sp. ZRKC2]|uniref:DUF2110 family protein n=1 Tax=Methanolobus sp. ZRKC2 TaxID=3125783 RepID=UPI00325507A6